MKLTQPLNHIANSSCLKADLLKWCSQAWQFMRQCIITSQEPRVWQRSDRDGTRWWYAYDPRTQRSLQCDSEDEVRFWLEELPYWHYRGEQ